jgi:hypothetical protein
VCIYINLFYIVYTREGNHRVNVSDSLCLDPLKISATNVLHHLRLEDGGKPRPVRPRYSQLGDFSPMNWSIAPIIVAILWPYIHLLIGYFLSLRLKTLRLRLKPGSFGKIVEPPPHLLLHKPSEILTYPP